MKSKKEITDIVVKKLRGDLKDFSSSFEEDRKKALRYYRGEPFGNEEENRSQIVSHDVAEVIDGSLPTLMEYFTSYEKSCEFQAYTKDLEQEVEIMTEYVRYVIFRKNRGTELFYDWMKSALLYRLGVLKVYWDTKKSVKSVPYKGITEQQLDSIKLDPQFQDTTIDITNEYQTPDGPAYDLKIKTPVEKSSVKIDVVPLNEFLFDPKAQNADDCRFYAHKMRVTRSDLLEMGYNKAVVNKVDFESDDEWMDDEERNRFSDEGDYFNTELSSASDEATEETYLYECYLNIDIDGDGIAELCKVCVAGHKNYTLLDYEDVADNPFAIITPNRMPFKLVGKSMADDVMDLQLLKSMLWRVSLDNAYLANSPRPVYDPDETETDDILNNELAYPVRSRNPQNINWLVPPVINNQDKIEYADAVKEQRTGVTRYNQGLDAETLNKTATGIKHIENMANKKVGLVARLFAETGVVRLYKLILNLLIEYQDYEVAMKLKNTTVQVNPQQWADFADDIDVVVKVGLGSKDTEREAMALTMLADYAEKIFGIQGDAKGPLVSMENLFLLLKDLSTAAGIQEPERYISDPRSPEMMAIIEEKEKRAAEDQESPEEALARAQTEAAMIRAQSEQAKNEINKERAAFDIVMQKEKLSREREKMEREFSLKEAELKAKYAQPELDITQKDALF